MLVGKSHWHTPGSSRGGFETWIPDSRLQRERERWSGRAGTLTGIGVNEFTPALSPYPPGLQTSDWAVDRACELIAERAREQPFCCWVWLVDPHPPLEIHEPFYSMYDHAEVPAPVRPAWAERDGAPRTLQHLRLGGQGHRWLDAAAMHKVRGVYQGMVTNLDHQIGRLLGALARDGSLADTLIVYTSDHGDHLGDHGMFFKATFLDGSGRVPLIVRPPASWSCARGAMNRSLVELADLLPTFVAAAGGAVPEDCCGHDLAPLCADPAAREREEWHGQIDDQHCFHDGRYKYCYFADDDRELCFDKERDPLDEHDLSGDETLIAPIRERFIAHLATEGHEHFVDGRPLDRGLTVDPDQAANVTGWMGYRA